MEKQKNKNLMTKKTINEIKVIDSIMIKQNFMDKYLEFKKVCITNGLFNIQEIIKLFEVYLNSL